MKDHKLKLEDIKDPHTLGGASYILFRYIGSWAGVFPNDKKKGTVNSSHLLTAEMAQFGGSSFG
jgi:hypothetical protein